MYFDNETCSIYQRGLRAQLLSVLMENCLTEIQTLFVSEKCLMFWGWSIMFRAWFCVLFKIIVVWKQEYKKEIIILFVEQKNAKETALWKSGRPFCHPCSNCKPCVAVWNKRFFKKSTNMFFTFHVRIFCDPLVEFQRERPHDWLQDNLSHSSQIPPSNSRFEKIIYKTKIRQTSPFEIYIDFLQ